MPVTAWRRAVMTAAAAFMIATQQSSIPLAAALLIVFIPLRWIAAGYKRGRSCRTITRLGWRRCWHLGWRSPPWWRWNAVGFGRLSISPYGNVFLLARVIYDGPGMTVLRRDCPLASLATLPVP